MSIKPWAALAAISALALSAKAQLYNWSLSTSGNGNPGNGSGTLTLTGGVVTALSGTVGGNSVGLLAPGSYYGNDNRLPLTPTSNGIGLQVATYGNLWVYNTGADIAWASNKGSFNAAFSYSPVPEPSTWAMGGVFGLAAVMTVAARRRQQVAKT